MRPRGLPGSVQPWPLRIKPELSQLGCQAWGVWVPSAGLAARRPLLVSLIKQVWEGPAILDTTLSSPLKSSKSAFPVSTL